MDHATSPACEPASARLFRRLLLGAALLVVLVRLCLPTHLGYDLTLQIQAAQHLLAGKGLTTYWSEAAELAAPNPLRQLVAWPCGFTLITAALLAIGLSLPVAIKVCGAAATLFGWWGLSRLAWLCFGLANSPPKLWQATALALAVTLPLLFTPDWDGTDIYVWAAAPWLILTIARGGAAEDKTGLKWVLQAGLLCGLCVLLRYAAVVLAVFAGLVLLLQWGRRPKLLLQRWLVLGLALAPALVLQLAIQRSGPRSAIPPGGLGGWPGGAALAGRVTQTAAQFTVAAYPFVSWAPERVARWVTRPERARPLLAALVAVALLSAPAIVARRAGCQGFGAAAQDPRVLAAGLAVATPLFLWACSGLSSFNHLAERRYYLPLVPLAPLIGCFLAAPVGPSPGGWLRALRAVSRIWLAGWVLSMIAGTVFLFAPGAHGEVQRRKLTGGASWQRFPAGGLSYESNEARRFVLEAMQADPRCWLLTNFEEWFFADPAADCARLHQLKPCELMAGRQLSGPARVLVLAHDQGGPVGELFWIGLDGQARKLECLESPVPPKLLHRFPQSHAKVIEFNLAAGQALVFK